MTKNKTKKIAIKKVIVAENKMNIFGPPYNALGDRATKQCRLAPIRLYLCAGACSKGRQNPGAPLLKQRWKINFIAIVEREKARFGPRLSPTSVKTFCLRGFNIGILVRNRLNYCVCGRSLAREIYWRGVGWELIIRWECFNICYENGVWLVFLRHQFVRIRW